MDLDRAARGSWRAVHPQFRFADPLRPDIEADLVFPASAGAGEKRACPIPVEIVQIVTEGVTDILRPIARLYGCKLALELREACIVQRYSHLGKALPKGRGLRIIEA